MDQSVSGKFISRLTHIDPFSDPLDPSEPEVVLLDLCDIERSDMRPIPSPIPTMNLPTSIPVKVLVVALKKNLLASLYMTSYK